MPDVSDIVTYRELLTKRRFLGTAVDCDVVLFTRVLKYKTSMRYFPFIGYMN